ncbi:crossover junction endodeoxyribonuclease RuvC [Lentisphaerota bacterium ZTH]|nr:crossover junction endodeoxyribonuclease RuvC [Lentisphaerota bacterium]WET06374.1 crossover junction endodeoxyribonuclease RuvC [Lentisphaerota bacterium ZTH]
MIILGIDPAIRCTGYGVINMRSVDDLEILDCGVIKNKQSMPHTECLRRITGGIRQLVEAFKPDVASIEEPFVGRNARTAIILGMARGAILAELAVHCINVYPYAPTSAKKAAVGTGKASKEQIAVMMSAQFEIDASNILLDSTDALALAVCHGRYAVRPDLKLLMPNPL